jgi:hypothetical protein
VFEVEAEEAEEGGHESSGVWWQRQRGLSCHVTPGVVCSMSYFHGFGLEAEEVVGMRLAGFGGSAREA